MTTMPMLRWINVFLALCATSYSWHAHQLFYYVDSYYMQEQGELPQKQDFRLEYVHIPKNAGSTIEMIGNQNNIAWGACHFEYPWKKAKNCPALAPGNGEWKRSGICHWHQAFRQLDQYAADFPFDPYDRVSVDDPYANFTKRFFTVIRDPFRRWVSWFQFSQQQGRNGVINSAHLNEWVVNMLTQGDETDYIDLGKNNVFPRCQSTYVHHPNGSASIEELLHFENLTLEFNELMESYEYPARMDAQAPRVNLGRIKKLTVANLTNETIDTIVRTCPDDFELGHGYPRYPLF